MAVSLWDTMRPVALLGGASAGCAPLTSSGALHFAAAAIGGLIAGGLAWSLAGYIGRRTPATATELQLTTLYASTFVGIVFCSYMGSYLAGWAFDNVPNNALYA